MTPADSIIITFIALIAVTCIKLYFNSKMDEDETEDTTDYVYYYGKSKEIQKETTQSIPKDIDSRPSVDIEDVSEPLGAQRPDERECNDQGAQRPDERSEQPTKYIISEGKTKVHKVSCVSGSRILNKVSVLEKDLHLYDKCKMCFR